MHCSKTIHENNLTIRITATSDIDCICRSQWQILQSKSLVTNPFFEDWNLIPAVKHLGDSSIYIINIYREGQLVALFPVFKKRHLGFIPSLSIWQHNHAYISDPLHAIELNWPTIFDQICRALRCHWFMQHNAKHNLFPERARVYSIKQRRAAIKNPQHIPQYIAQLHGKRQRELQRVHRKIEQYLAPELIKFDCNKKGLTAYMDLEHQGWKGEEAGAILSRSSVTKYYQDMLNLVPDNQWEVYGLFSQNVLLACAMRIQSNHQAFEIKTTFNEDYRLYAPGKMLEYYLLNDLAASNFTQVDSCTDADNALINWLWPDSIVIYRSYMFTSHPIGVAMNAFHSAKRWIKKRVRYA